MNELLGISRRCLCAAGTSLTLRERRGYRGG
nr:MAG TPA: hypothetical protein [Caudoviricetes sp.]